MGGTPNPQPPASSRSMRGVELDIPAIPFRFDSQMEWTASFDASSRQVVITKSSGRCLYYKAAPHSDRAERQGISRRDTSLVQLLNSDLTPCTHDRPAFLCQVMADGSKRRFSTETGKVVSTTTRSGAVTTADEYAKRLQVTRDAAGEVTSIWSSTQGLFLMERSFNKLVIKQYSGDQVVSDARTGRTASGLPLKTYSYECWQEGSAKMMKIINQRTGQPATEILREVDDVQVKVTTGTGDDRIVKTFVRNYLPGGMWEEIRSVRAGSDTTSCVRTVKKSTAGGWLTISRTEGYGSSSPRTTTWVYNDQFRPSLEIKPDGGYTRYEYDAQGRVVLEASPWGAGSDEKLVRTTYANLRFNDCRPLLKIESILKGNGTETELSRTSYSYSDSAQVNRTTVTQTGLGVTGPRISIRETYGELAACSYACGRVKLEEDVNGLQKCYTYERTAQYGAVWMRTMETAMNGQVVSGRSERRVRYIAANGDVTREENYVHAGTGWKLAATADYEYDFEHNVTKTTFGNGRISTAEWMCCGPLRKTDEDGILTSYGYNTARQLVETIRAATETTPETIVSYTRDGAGRILTERRDVGAMTTQILKSYDRVGRMISSTDALGRVTTWAYNEAQRTTTRTAPSGATLITIANPDGTPWEESGTGQRNLRYGYEVVADGIRTTVSAKTSGGQWVAVSRTTRNGLGETIREERANTQGGWIVTEHSYNALGQLVRSRTGQMAPTLYEYDVMGEVSKRTLALEDVPTPQNSRVEQTSRTYESRADGVYDSISTTTYNQNGDPLVETVSKLVSSLSPTLESRKETKDIYGKITEEWSEYAAPTQRMQYLKIPTSTLVACSVVVDGWLRQATDNVGIETSQSRNFTATGMTITRTDGRGNTTVTETDLAGRTVKLTDAAGAVTTTAYDSRFDQPSCITNALGNTTCYAYDIRGRKISEYGTAIQPAVFGYDEMDHMIRLTTFRVPGSVITTDPSSRTDGDTTSWTYDEATGLQLKKTYADNSQLVYTYDAMNRQSTQTLARGIVITYTYDLLAGDMTGISYGDTTPDYSFEYDRFGSIQSISQEGHSIPVEQRGYNEYNQLELECYFRGNDECYHIRHYDEYGRINFDTLQIVRNFMLAEIAYEITTEYNDLGQLSRYIYNLGQEDERAFQFNYLSGTHFVSSIAFPDPVSLEYTYEPVRDLLSGIMCRNSAENMISNRTQICDLLGRPTERTQIREGVTREDQFIYNSLNELTRANLGGTPFNYGYDNIGNRKDSEEFDKMTSYLSNNLNQYTSIDPEEEPAFIPTYDADGNQTRVRTTTGTWDVVYNAKNRPVRFSSSDGTLVIECTYDYMGRRTHKILKRNDKLEFDEMYHYNDYLQTAAIRGTETQHVILWNPTETVATRPLAQIKNGNFYYAVHDFVKNITEWVTTSGSIEASFDYTPYGTIMNETGDLALGCIGFSSEVMNQELGMIYYNYRYLNPLDGRWINRDYVKEIYFSYNLYQIIYNNPIGKYDFLGLMECNKDKLGDKGDFSYSINLYSMYEEKLKVSDPIKQFFDSTKEIITKTIEGKIVETLETTLDMVADGAKLPIRAIEAVGSAIKKQGNIGSIVIEAKGKICCCDSKGGYKVYDINGKVTENNSYILDPLTFSDRSLSKEAKRLERAIEDMSKQLGERMRDINCDNKDEHVNINV